MPPLEQTLAFYDERFRLHIAPAAGFVGVNDEYERLIGWLEQWRGEAKIYMARGKALAVTRFGGLYYLDGHVLGRNDVRTGTPGLEQGCRPWIDGVVDAWGRDDGRFLAAVVVSKRNPGGSDLIVFDDCVAAQTIAGEHACHDISLSEQCRDGHLTGGRKGPTFTSRQIEVGRRVLRGWIEDQLLVTAEVDTGDNAKGEQGPVFVVARKMPSLEKSTEIAGFVSQKGLREGEEELELSMATLLIWKGLEKKLLKVPLDGSPRTSVEIQDAERGVGDDLWRCRGAAMGRLIQASGTMDTLQWRVVEAATGRVEYLAPSTTGVAFVDVDSGGRIWIARSEGICQVAPKNSLIPDP